MCAEGDMQQKYQVPANRWSDFVQHRNVPPPHVSHTLVGIGHWTHHGSDIGRSRADEGESSDDLRKHSANWRGGKWYVGRCEAAFRIINLIDLSQILQLG